MKYLVLLTTLAFSLVSCDSYLEFGAKIDITAEFTESQNVNFALLCVEAEYEVQYEDDKSEIKEQLACSFAKSVQDGESVVVEAEVVFEDSLYGATGAYIKNIKKVSVTADLKESECQCTNELNVLSTNIKNFKIYSGKPSSKQINKISNSKVDIKLGVEYSSLANDEAMLKRNCNKEIDKMTGANAYEAREFCKDYYNPLISWCVIDIDKNTGANAYEAREFCKSYFHPQVVSCAIDIDKKTGANAYEAREFCKFWNSKEIVSCVIDTDKNTGANAYEAREYCKNLYRN